jgi:hypothetical protein
VANLLLSNYLADTVRQIESIPNATQTFTDDQILQLMNIELQSAIVPMLSKLNEEYFVFTRDVPVTPTTTTIPIPSDAIGMMLREVCWLDANEQITRIPRVSLEVATMGSSFSCGYWVQQNSLKFKLNSLQTGTLRLFYLRRPATLVNILHAGEVVSVDTGTGYITLASLPIDAPYAGSLISICSSLQPNAYILESATVIGVVGLNVQLSLADAALVSVGDWLTWPGQAPFAQYIPQEATHLLCQGTAVRCCEGMGDQASWKTANTQYQTMYKDLQSALTGRVVSEPKIIGGSGGLLDSYGYGGMFR